MPGFHKVKQNKNSELYKEPKVSNPTRRLGVKLESLYKDTYVNKIFQRLPF